MNSAHHGMRPLSGGLRPVGVGIAITLLTMLSALPAHGAKPDLDSQRLEALAEFAERICSSVKQYGSSTKALASAEAKAQVKGLTKKLADIGGGVGVQYSKETFEGVTQADLPRVLDSTANCKLKVIELYRDKLFPSALSAPRDPAPTKESAVRTSRVQATGDPVIDRVETTLRTLKARDHSESELAHALGPLFSRPAFYAVRNEESWEYFLYALCKTRMVVEENIGEFKAHPEVRNHLGEAVSIMVDMQGESAKLFGPTFSVTDHIRRYIYNRDAFVSNLVRTKDPDAAFESLRRQEMGKLHAEICSAGVGEVCPQSPAAQASPPRPERPVSVARVSTNRERLMFSAQGDGEELDELSADGLDDAFRGPIVIAMSASSRRDVLVAPRLLVEVIDASVAESYSLPGCSVAEQVTLTYRAKRSGVATAPGYQAVTGRGACIGADRKEAIVQATQFAASAMKAQLAN